MLSKAFSSCSSRFAAPPALSCTWDRALQVWDLSGAAALRADAPLSCGTAAIHLPLAQKDEQLAAAREESLALSEQASLY